MAPKRTMRSSPATTTTTTTPVTNSQLKALIDQGVTDALEARDADRSQNSEDIHDSRTGVRRQAHPARECTYQDFMKCKPLYFKLDKIERYIGGLSDMIHESLMASKLKTMQDAVGFATELMDKKVRTFVECQTKNKRKQDDNQQQENKRSFAATNNQRNLTCYECGNQGHYRSDFPELKNQNHRNQAEGTGARGMVHALGGG
uniref:CCHC-type domain-containing protein n=1 Tax=Tanacetum cinerariifolium TaxID=118510 RepID=A0A699GM03_TANCI|nr:hypothetical protein [Tanacetum cinerariifolium]